MRFGSLITKIFASDLRAYGFSGLMCRNLQNVLSIPPKRQQTLRRETNEIVIPSLIGFHQI